MSEGIDEMITARLIVQQWVNDEAIDEPISVVFQPTMDTLNIRCYIINQNAVLYWCFEQVHTFATNSITAFSITQ